MWRDLVPADDDDDEPARADRSEVVMGDIVHGNKYGGDHVEGDKIINPSGYGRARPHRSRTILLMSANPDGQQPLRLDEERREIDRAVTYGPAADRLEVRTADALRLDDLQSALLRHRPVIAHFSGHGAAGEGILVTDDRGRAHPVPPDALSDLFGILRRDLRCVFLNACYTDVQAHAIARHVPCVIGMHSRVLDRSAIRFAAAFYQGIAHGETIGVAFDLGRNSLSLNRHPDTGVPRLIAAPGVAGRRLVRRQ